MKSISEQLLDMYDRSGKERVGFILEDGEIVEVANISSLPNQSFLISATDLVKHIGQAVASWHTHPGRDAVPSQMDRIAFANYQHLVHYIVGKDGVAPYIVDTNGSVQRVTAEEADSLTRMVASAA